VKATRSNFKYKKKSSVRKTEETQTEGGGKESGASPDPKELRIPDLGGNASITYEEKKKGRQAGTGDRGTA